VAITPPHELTLRCYGVGFGDCFLLTFHYKGTAGDRHMLIDFGCTQKPPNAGGDLMKAIAKDITAVVGSKLHAVVATHRHTDHISGFATNAKGNAPGDLIGALKPELVIQPWTERLDAPVNSKGPKKGLALAANDALRLALHRMTDVAAMSLKEAEHLPKLLKNEVKFISEDFVGEKGVKNLSAVKQLAKMGKKGKAAYVQYGSKLPTLKTLFPGVTFDVLGPPTIAQKKDVADQNPRNEDEYWHFARFWGVSAATARMATSLEGTLFPGAAVFKRGAFPIQARWFASRLRSGRGQNLLRIVRAMDDAMNNTSVILLITAGTKKLLFPGDAQWENWEHALTHNLKDLEDVDVYKVGHHGSLNATPKTLWNNFKKKSRKKSGANRLMSVMSTVTDSKHGDPEHDSEVPREKLVTALRGFSTLRTTQELEADGDLVMKITFDLTKT